MIDITAAIIALTGGVISTGAHLLEIGKINKLEKIAKMHRMELVGLEATTAASCMIQVVDNILWKKEFKRLKEQTEKDYVETKQQIDNLSMRIDNLATTIGDRAPVVTIVPTPVEKEHEVVDVEENK